MSGGALGAAAAGAMRRPTIGSVTASTFLLAGSQALGILLSPTGVKRGTFNDFSVNPGDASDTVAYIAGTVETTPHLITHFDFASKKVKNDVEVAQMLLNAGLSGLAGYIAGGGSFGLAPDPPTAYIGLAEGTVFGAIVAGLGQLRTASIRYYCGFLYGICHGVINSIEAVKVDERIVSFGAAAGDQFLIDDPQAWGGDHVDGGVYALAKSFPGHFWPTQQPDPYLIAQLGGNVASWSGKAMFLIYGWSGFTESGYFAATPQGSPAVRPLKLRVKRLPDNLGVTAYHDIGGDANIAECCFEWLTSPVFGVKKLPLSKIDVASFQLGAQTHHTRGLGISVEMNSDVDVETALDKFTDLGGSIIYGSFNSGTIRYKVIERNYSIPALPVFRRGPDGSAPNAYNVIRVSGFTPGSWANTANDFAFDYLDRGNNYLKTTRYVQDIANRMLTGRVRSLSQSLDGVSNGATAAFVGTRELRAGAYPRPPITLVVNRDGYLREPSDVIKYIDNVDNFVKVLRITEVQKLATDETAEIVLNCVEDQYGVGATAYSPFVAPGFSLTHHLQLSLEDNFFALSGPAVVLPGLRDAISLSAAVPLAPSGFSDSINNWADDVDLSLAVAGCELLTTAPTTNLQFDLTGDCLTGNDGDAISAWVDAAPAGNDLGTFSGGSIVKRNILNGHAVLRTVTDDNPLFTSPIAVTNFTYIAVVKLADLLGQRTLIAGNAGSPQVRFNLGKLNVLKQATADMGTATTALTAGTFFTVAATYDGSTVKFYLNGAADGTNSTAQTFTADLIRILQANGLENFSGDLARHLFWTSVLNEATHLLNSGGGVTDELRTEYAHY